MPLAMLLLLTVLTAAPAEAIAGPCGDVGKDVLQAVESTTEGRQAWTSRDPISCERGAATAAESFRFWSGAELSGTTCGYWWRYERAGSGVWRGPTGC